MGTAAIAGGAAVLVAAVAAARLLPRGGVVPPGDHPELRGGDLRPDLEGDGDGDVVDEEVVTPSPILD
jgi:hypothetical protein